MGNLTGQSPLQNLRICTGVFNQREQLQRGYGKNGKESERVVQKNAQVRDTNGGVFWKIIRRKKCTSELNSRMIQIDQEYPTNGGKMNPRIDLYRIYLWLVFIFLFHSSLSRALLPAYVNYVGVLGAIILAAYFLTQSKSTLLLQLLLYIYWCLSAFSLYFQGENILDLQVWSFFFIVMIAISIGENLGYLLKITKVFLILNLIALIWEKLNGQFIFMPDAESGYEGMSAYYYGQGLHTYAKGAAEFLVISLLLYRGDLHMKSIIFISILFTGVRSALVLSLVIFATEIFMNSMKTNYNWRRVFLLIIGFFVSYYLVQSEFIYSGRWLSILDFDSPTYVDRFWIVSQHLQCYQDLPVFQQLFGSGFHCGNMFEWGSESFPIQILTYYGLVFFALYLAMIVMLIYKMFNIPNGVRDLHPFLWVLLVGLVVRFPVGWFGAVVYFGLLFVVLFKPDKWKTLRLQLGLR